MYTLSFSFYFIFHFILSIETFHCNKSSNQIFLFSSFFKIKSVLIMSIIIHNREHHHQKQQKQCKAVVCSNAPCQKLVKTNLIFPRDQKYLLNDISCLKILVHTIFLFQIFSVKWFCMDFILFYLQQCSLLNIGWNKLDISTGKSICQMIFLV